MPGPENQNRSWLTLELLQRMRQGLNQAKAQIARAERRAREHRLSSPNGSNVNRALAELLRHQHAERLRRSSENGAYKRRPAKRARKEKQPEPGYYATVDDDDKYHISAYSCHCEQQRRELKQYEPHCRQRAHDLRRCVPDHSSQREQQSVRKSLHQHVNERINGRECA